MTSLPLDLDLPQLFTPAQARASGVDRVAVERMLRQGVLRRVRRGVLAPIDLPDTLEVRAAALALVVPRARVVVGRSAAWLHELDVDVGGADVVDLAPPRSMLLAARDVVRRGDVLVTTRARTAADLASEPDDDRALAVLDGFLRAGLIQRDLLGQLAGRAGLRGVGRLRRLAPLADGRARDPCESVLRLRWLDAGLPTPVPGAVVAGQRLALALPVQRFGVTLDAGTPPGWRTSAVSRARVLTGDPQLLEQWLRAEFHQALLKEVG